MSKLPRLCISVVTALKKECKGQKESVSKLHIKQCKIRNVPGSYVFGLFLPLSCMRKKIILNCMFCSLSLTCHLWIWLPGVRPQMEHRRNDHVAAGGVTKMP